MAMQWLVGPLDKIFLSNKTESIINMNSLVESPDKMLG